MNLLYCKHCGKEISNLDSNFCNHCGGLLKEDSSEKFSSVGTWFQQTKEKILTNSKPRIEQARTSILSGLDKLIESIKDPDNLNFGGKELSPRYREKLATTLAALKERIQISPTDGTEPEKLNYDEIQAEELLTEELINQLRKDRCIICYADFKDLESVSVLICPHCGQGGHYNHLEAYIKSNDGQCPVCRQKSIFNKWFSLKL